MKDNVILEVKNVEKFFYGNKKTVSERQTGCKGCQ
mgnify:CR=1 FL=1